jgi:hypothetical protein
LGACPQGLISLKEFFFFQKKKQKALVLLRRRPFHIQNSAKPTLPRTNWFKVVLLFPEKEAKSISSASQKTLPYSKLGEADPGGLGACPQEKD